MLDAAGGVSRSSPQAVVPATPHRAPQYGPYVNHAPARGPSQCEIDQMRARQEELRRQAEAARRAAEEARRRAEAARVAAEAARELAEKTREKADQREAARLGKSAAQEDLLARRAEAKANLAEAQHKEQASLADDAAAGRGADRPSAATLDAKDDVKRKTFAASLLEEPPAGKPNPLDPAGRHTDALLKDVEDAAKPVFDAQSRSKEPSKKHQDTLDQTVGAWLEGASHEMRLAGLQAQARGEDPLAAMKKQADSIAGRLPRSGPLSGDAMHKQFDGMLDKTVDQVKTESPAKRQAMTEVHDARLKDDKDRAAATQAAKQADKNADQAQAHAGSFGTHNSAAAVAARENAKNLRQIADDAGQRADHLKPDSAQKQIDEVDVDIRFQQLEVDEQQAAHTLAVQSGDGKRIHDTGVSLGLAQGGLTVLKSQRENLASKVDQGLAKDADAKARSDWDSQRAGQPELVVVRGPAGSGRNAGITQTHTIEPPGYDRSFWAVPGSADAKQVHKGDDGKYYLDTGKGDKVLLNPAAARRWETHDALQAADTRAANAHAALAVDTADFGSPEPGSPPGRLDPRLWEGRAKDIGDRVKQADQDVADARSSMRGAVDHGADAGEIDTLRIDLGRALEVQKHAKAEADVFKDVQAWRSAEQGLGTGSPLTRQDVDKMRGDLRKKIGVLDEMPGISADEMKKLHDLRTQDDKLLSDVNQTIATEWKKFGKSGGSKAYHDALNEKERIVLMTRDHDLQIKELDLHFRSVADQELFGRVDTQGPKQDGYGPGGVFLDSDSKDHTVNGGDANYLIAPPKDAAAELKGLKPGDDGNWTLKDGTKLSSDKKTWTFTDGKQITERDGKYFVSFEERHGTVGEATTSTSRSAEHELDPLAARMWRTTGDQLQLGEDRAAFQKDQDSYLAKFPPTPPEGTPPKLGADGNKVPTLNFGDDLVTRRTEVTKNIDDLKSKLAALPPPGAVVAVEPQRAALQSELDVANAQLRAVDAMAAWKAADYANKDELGRGQMRRLGGEPHTGRDRMDELESTAVKARSDWLALRDRQTVAGKQLKVDEATLSHDAWKAQHPGATKAQEEDADTWKGLQAAVADHKKAQDLQTGGSTRVANTNDERAWITRHLSPDQYGDNRELYKLFEANPQVMAQGIINDHYQQYGDQPITMQGRTNIGNEVGLALGWPPAPGISTGAAGQSVRLHEDMFSEGLTQQQRDMKGAVVDQIAKVGGEHAKVTVLPVVYALDGRSGGVVKTALFKVDGRDGVTKYVDEEGKRYDDLRDYRANNSLPVDGVQLVIPKDGKFDVDPDGNVKVSVLDARTETGWETFRRKTHLDTAVGVVGIAAGVVMTIGSMGTLSVPGTAIALASATLIGASVYGVTTSAMSLHDQSSHGVDIGWSNRQARLDWLNLGASALAIPTLGAAGRAGVLAAELKNASGATKTALEAGVQGYGAVGKVLSVPTTVLGGAAFEEGGRYMADTWDQMSDAEKWEQGGMMLLNVADMASGFMIPRLVKPRPVQTQGGLPTPPAPTLGGGTGHIANPQGGGGPAVTPQAGPAGIQVGRGPADPPPGDGGHTATTGPRSDPGGAGAPDPSAPVAQAVPSSLAARPLDIPLPDAPGSVLPGRTSTGKGPGGDESPATRGVSDRNEDPVTRDRHEESSPTRRRHWPWASARSQEPGGSVRMASRETPAPDGDVPAARRHGRTDPPEQSRHETEWSLPGRDDMARDDRNALLHEVHAAGGQLMDVEYVVHSTQWDPVTGKLVSPFAQGVSLPHTPGGTARHATLEDALAAVRPNHGEGEGIVLVSKGGGTAGNDIPGSGVIARMQLHTENGVNRLVKLEINGNYEGAIRVAVPADHIPGRPLIRNEGGRRIDLLNAPEGGGSAGLSLFPRRQAHLDMIRGERRDMLPVPEGVFAVDAHGLEGIIGAQGEVLGAADIASLISQHRAYHGQEVLFFTCLAGDGAVPLAQGVATLLGTNVYAPTQSINLNGAPLQGKSGAGHDLQHTRSVGFVDVGSSYNGGVMRAMLGNEGADLPIVEIRHQGQPVYMDLPIKGPDRFVRFSPGRLGQANQDGLIVFPADPTQVHALDPLLPDPPTAAPDSRPPGNSGPPSTVRMASGRGNPPGHSPAAPSPNSLLIARLSADPGSSGDVFAVSGATPSTVIPDIVPGAGVRAKRGDTFSSFDAAASAAASRARSTQAAGGEAWVYRIAPDRERLPLSKRGHAQPAEVVGALRIDHDGTVLQAMLPGQAAPAGGKPSRPPAALKNLADIVNAEAPDGCAMTYITLPGTPEQLLATGLGAGIALKDGISRRISFDAARADVMARTQNPDAPVTVVRVIGEIEQVHQLLMDGRPIPRDMVEWALSMDSSGNPVGSPLPNPGFASAHAPGQVAPRGGVPPATRGSPRREVMVQLPDEKLTLVDPLLDAGFKVRRFVRRATGRTLVEPLSAGSRPRPGLVEQLGRAPLDHGKSGDSHIHPQTYASADYYNPLGFGKQLVAAKMFGLRVLHPIPQETVGVAGAQPYYLDVDQLRPTSRGDTMLRLDAVRNDLILEKRIDAANAELRRTNQGDRPDRDLFVAAIAGGGGFQPGSAAYNRLYPILHPGHGAVIAEATLSKEGVGPALGPEGVLPLNPAFTQRSAAMTQGMELLRAGAARGDIDPALLGEALPSLSRMAGEPGADVQAAWQALSEMDALSDELAAAVGLPSGRVDGPTLWHPGLDETLTGLQVTGQSATIHNDAGIPLLMRDGGYSFGPPDARNALPLIAALMRHPGEHVVAHLMTGKFTGLSLKHLDLVEWVLNHPKLKLTKFDISWNDLAQHISSDPRFKQRMVELMIRHSTRFELGTDGINPQNVPHYARHFHDMEDLLRTVQRLDPEAYVNITYRNLEGRLARAQERTAAYAYAELNSGNWEGVVESLTPRRQEAIATWMDEQRLQRTGQTETTPAPELRETESDMQAVVDLVDWTNATDRGRAAEVIQAFGSAMRGDSVMRALDADDMQAPEMTLLRDPAGQPYLDPAGHPWTLEALVAAHQARKLGLPPELQEATLLDVQAAQLRQNNENTLRGAAVQKMRRVYHRWLAAASVLGAGGTAALATQIPPALLARLGGAAFMARGAVGLYKTAQQQTIRVVHESMLERGRITPEKVDALTSMIRRWAPHFTKDPDLLKTRLADFDAASQQFKSNLDALLKPLGDDADPAAKAAQAPRILAEYSRFCDQINRAMGVTALSLEKTNTRTPVGNTMSWITSGTFMVNAAAHATQTVQSFREGNALDGFTNLGFLGADLAYLRYYLPESASGLAGFNAAAEPSARRVLNWAATPLVTVGSALLTSRFVTDAVHAASEHMTGDAVKAGALGLAAGVLTTATGYQTWQGFKGEVGLGVRQPRKIAAASAGVGTALLILGAYLMQRDDDA